MVIVGITLQGVSFALALVPCMPNIIKAVEKKENMQENDMLNDKASGMFNFSYSLGAILGPILGGTLSDYFESLKKNGYK